MSLTAFRVQSNKSLVLAHAEHVPPIMVIAGPNGVGKSTLLYAIKDQGTITPGTRVFYQGPHRVLRRTQVQRRWLGGAIRWFTDLVTSGDVSGYEGLSFQNSSRTPDNVDEAGSTIKHILGKIENRRQAILAELVDKRREASQDLVTTGIPDVYKSLRQMTEHLLPHLIFHRVDFSNEDVIKCLWKRADAANSLELDIDDLSSGEKAIVVLFLPLIEDQIRKALDTLSAQNVAEATVAQPEVDRVVLIDEPEQHLHPDLQAKILNYMRAQTMDGHVQFILTTHSPTILDQASDSELYVLSAPSGTTPENQLRRVANNLERLEVLRELAGSTYFLTTGRAIVCIEGETSDDPAEPTDMRLLELMYPRATAVTLVPTTGKSNVYSTVTRLREYVPEDIFRIRIRGLVDADQSVTTVAGVEKLPVAMIENLLLESNAIMAVAATRKVQAFQTTESVNEVLTELATELRSEEVALRVRQNFKRRYIQLKGSTVEEVRQSHADAITEVQRMLPTDADMETVIANASASVQEIVSRGEMLLRFRGKRIVEKLYTRFFAAGDFGYSRFCIAVAAEVGSRKSVVSALDPVFDRLLA